MIDERYHSRVLDNKDCSELFVLHRRVIESLPDSDLYLAKRAEYFKARLEGKLAASTTIFGIFFQGEMVAYSSVRVLLYSSAFADLVIFPKPSWQGIPIALMEDAAVHPNHRGRGFQALLMRAKSDIARQRGVTLDISLVNVKNFPSLRTLLAVGFVAIGTTTVASGVSRLVLARSADTRPRDLVASSQRVTDWAEIQAMFARGYVAVDVHKAADSIKPTRLIFASRPRHNDLYESAEKIRNGTM